MSTSGDTRRAAAADLLAAGQGLTAAADKLGLHAKTLSRWLEDSDFRAAVQTARSRLFDVTSGQLAALSAAAATRLGELVASSNERIACRACAEVLGAVFRSRELVDLAGQVQELREQLAALRRPRLHG